MKKRFIWAFILTSLAGTGMHFAFKLLPVPLVGLFAPVNESPWEHVKLVYWPFLTASAVLSFGDRAHRAQFWGAAFAAVLTGVWALLGTYYLAEAGLGIESLRFDIALYFAVMLLVFWLLYALSKLPRLAWAGSVLLIPVFFLGACLILFSIQAPDLPLFQVPV